MAQNEESVTLTLEVSGSYHDFAEPPEGLPVSVVERTTTRSFDGASLLHMVLSIDWPAVAQAATGGVAGKLLYDIAKWLYARFSSQPKSVQSPAESQTTIDVTLGDRKRVLIVTSSEDLAEKLKEVLNDADQ
jgi:hypothetical protein